MWALGDCWAVAGTWEVWKSVSLNCIWRRSFLGVWLDIQSPRSLSPGTATPLPRHPLMVTVTQKAPEKARSYLQTSSLEQVETGEHVLQVTPTHELFSEWEKDSGCQEPKRKACQLGCWDSEVAISKRQFVPPSHTAHSGNIQIEGLKSLMSQ